MILLVFVIQCLVYKEVTALFDLSFSELYGTIPGHAYNIILTLPG